MTALRGEWRRNFPMSRLSAWRVGGPAEELFLPADLDDMRAFYETGSRARTAFVIGHGSNLLVRDGGIGGVVARAAPGLSVLRVEKDGRIYAEAGAGCPKLARLAADAGFAEAAFLAGVPGTVGGAAAMNAGCEGGEIWTYVEEAAVLEDGGLRVRPRADFSAGYRSISMKDGAATPFFAAVRLRFSPGDPSAARARVRAMLRRRARTQPVGSANCGSVFCNPPGGFAAKLIDECGLKGARVGGATVSQKHANFIVNDRRATAADIENLIFIVREKVRARTGVLLSPEVRIAGRKIDSAAPVHELSGGRYGK
ncbi:MAG: UDP-N-acetylmuramate dehydrogenase [Gammaproteobacteria bacterium]